MAKNHRVLPTFQIFTIPSLSVRWLPLSLQDILVLGLKYSLSQPELNFLIFNLTTPALAYVTLLTEKMTKNYETTIKRIVHSLLMGTVCSRRQKYVHLNAIPGGAGYFC